MPLLLVHCWLQFTACACLLGLVTLVTGLFIAHRYSRFTTLTELPGTATCLATLVELPFLPTSQPAYLALTCLLPLSATLIGRLLLFAVTAFCAATTFRLEIEWKTLSDLAYAYCLTCFLTSPYRLNYCSFPNYRYSCLYLLQAGLIRLPLAIATLTTRARSPTSNKVAAFMLFTDWRGYYNYC